MKYGMLLVVLLIMMGCSSNSSTEIISDEITSPDVEIIIDVDSDWITHHYPFDNMDRGNHDYYDQVLVIAPRLQGLEFSRGNVVFFSNSTNGKMISRVIALPGEKINISDGQIYINNKRLDTFYGKAHRLGLDKESYFPAMDKAGVEYNKKGILDEVFELSNYELGLAENEYYVVSDDWFRGTKQIIKKDEIIGEVLGYQYGDKNQRKVVLGWTSIKK